MILYNYIKLDNPPPPNNIYFNLNKLIHGIVYTSLRIKLNSYLSKDYLLLGGKKYNLDGWFKLDFLI